MFLVHGELCELKFFLLLRYSKEKYKRENYSVSTYKTNRQVKIKIPGNFFLLHM